VNMVSGAILVSGATAAAARSSGAGVRRGTTVPGQPPGDLPGAVVRSPVTPGGTRAHGRIALPDGPVIGIAKAVRGTGAPGPAGTKLRPGRHASPDRGFPTRSAPSNSTPRPGTS
jgi:hypothetical protein